MILSNLVARPLRRCPDLCLLAGVAMTLTAALAGGPTGDHDGGAAANVQTRTSPSGAATPDSSLASLIAGNERFTAGQSQHPNCDAARRTDCANNGQHPFATILTCSDSRLAAERIFDQGIGDVFVVRVAGNVGDTDEIGTIEYGVGHLHTPLLVVMGHTKCGAVKAACSGGDLEGCLPKLIDNIIPAVANARHANPKLEGDALLTAAVDANVMQSISDILRRSGEVRHLISSNSVKVVGAVYDLETGRVRWLGSHPDQGRVLAQMDGGGHAAPPTARATPTDGGGHSTEAHSNNTAHASADSTEGGPAPTVVAGVTMERGTGDNHAKANPGSPKDSHASPPLPSAGEALQQLREGNIRFVSGRTSNPRCDLGWVAQTAGGQHPFVTILTCSDSRLPVERVFDQGIGDIFVVRVAGNVADVDEIASIEYATAHLHTPLLVVLGHTSCGAVTAVAGHADVHGCIPQLVDNIVPAVTRTLAWDPTLTDKLLVSAAIRANVQQSMQDVVTRSPVVRDLVANGKLMIVGGVYDLAAGTIEWLDDPTRSSASPSPAAATAPKATDSHPAESHRQKSPH